VAAGIGSSLLRYGVPGRRSRSGLTAVDRGEVVAGDRLGLRTPVLVAGERVDHVRGVGRDVEVEHLPVAVRRLPDGEFVADAGGVAVAPNW
jgi:hypothetical protein